jgi:hypothetical protein
MSFTVQHKRTGDFSKRPAPTSLVQGQLAVNYNQDSAGLFFKTDGNTLVKVGPTAVGDTEPQLLGWTERSEGEMWLDTSLSNVPILKVWTDSGWVSVSAALAVSTVFVPPTSATGLPSGALWNNNGVLTIVP